MASHSIGGYTGEQEIYVDANFAGKGSTALGLNPFSVNDGVLSITAGLVPTQDQNALWGYQYYSGLLTTQNSFSQTYGYFEMRAELPSGAGGWPAFWLYPVNPTANKAEIDVLETSTSSPDFVKMTGHDTSLTGGSSQGGIYVPNATTAFNDYAVSWTPQFLTWFVNGAEVYQIATPANMNQPMYILLDMALGGEGGTINPSALPSAFEIAWVHAYSLTGALTYNSTSSGGLSSTSSTASAPSTTTTTTVSTADAAVNLTSGANIVVDSGLGGDTINGGSGSTTVVYSGKEANYEVYSDGSGGYYVESQALGSNPSSFDHLTNVSELQFADATAAPSALSVGEVAFANTAGAKIALSDGTNIIVDSGAGGDVINGQTDAATVVYSGKEAQYEVYADGSGGYYVENLALGSNPANFDHLLNVDTIQFADTSVAPSAISLSAATEITSLFDTYFGRDPSSSDLSTWESAIAGGASFNTLRTDLLNDPYGQAHTVSEITSLFDTYFGRDPSSVDLSTWESAIADGADFNTLRTDLLNDPYGQAHTVSEVTSLFDTYFGRDPSSVDLSTWESAIADGADFNTLRTDLLNDPYGQAHTVSEVTSLFDTYFGRDPSSVDLSTWESAIAGGASFNTLRTDLLNDPYGQAHTVSEATSLFDTYFGRDPTSLDLSTWESAIAGGANFSTLRTDLLNDPYGQAHTVSEITSLFDTYFGRDPSSVDLSTWESAIASGANFSTLRTDLVNDPYGQAHTVSEITSLFDTFNGSAPSSSDLSTWESAIASGADFSQLQDTLERNSIVPSVQHIIASGSAQSFTFPSTSQNMTIDGFNPQIDTINISSQFNNGVGILNAAHAQQINAQDGTTDVLITLDYSHSILIEHAHLASLSSNDFVYS